MRVVPGYERVLYYQSGAPQVRCRHGEQACVLLGDVLAEKTTKVIADLEHFDRGSPSMPETSSGIGITTFPG